MSGMFFLAGFACGIGAVLAIEACLFFMRLFRDGRGSLRLPE
ncbi:hypothetical protein [Chrysiogenes arsenatis]|nr:hypothetical protein [Chrysiogenes arsenatis]